MSVKFLGWTYFGDGFSSIGEQLQDCIDFRSLFSKFKDASSAEKHRKLEAIAEECYDVLIERCKGKGIKFDGEYHQNGEYGCPVFETDLGVLKYDFTFRGWGQVMVDAGFAKNYADWAWHDYKKRTIPDEVEEDEFLLYKG